MAEFYQLYQEPVKHTQVMALIDSYEEVPL